MPRYSFFCIKKEHEKKTFLPRLNKVTNRLEPSIYLINELSEDEIWDIGQRCVVDKAQERENESASQANRESQRFRLMGRFDFNSDCLSQHNIRLHIETDNHPCDGHSNLLG